MTCPDSLPLPVNVESLKNHFKSAYMLTDAQIDLMVESSAESLKSTLLLLRKATENNNNFNDISVQSHRLKGVLLNMGENDWAEIVRQMEKSASRKEHKKYSSIVESLHIGMADILSFGQGDE